MKTLSFVIASSGIVLFALFNSAGSASTSSQQRIPKGSTFEIPAVDLICKVYPRGGSDEGPYVGCVRRSNLYSGRSREVYISRWHYRISDARNTRIVYTVGRTP